MCSSDLPELAAADARELVGLDEASFQRQMGPTPLERPGRTGLVRNAAGVAGNSRRHEAIEPLVGLLDDVEPVVRSSAAWALRRIGNPAAVDPLRQRRSVENMEDVQNEIDAAIEAASAGSQCDE